jgi:hypothetical protein
VDPTSFATAIAITSISIVGKDVAKDREEAEWQEVWSKNQ